MSEAILAIVFMCSFISGIAFTCATIADGGLDELPEICTSIDKFLTVVAAPQVAVYWGTESSLRKSGVVILLILSSIFWCYINVILLGLAIIAVIFYWLCRGFYHIFKKEEED